MPRTVSLAAMQAMLAQSTSEAFLCFLIIDHADLADPLYLVDNTADVTRNSEVHTAFPFKISLPEDSEEGISSVTLTIATVDQQIQEIIRSLSTPFTVTLAVALASSPDTTEAGPFTFESLGATFDGIAAQIQLGFNTHMLNQAFPAGIVAPSSAGPTGL